VSSSSAGPVKIECDPRGVDEVLTAKFAKNVGPLAFPTDAKIFQSVDMQNEALRESVLHPSVSGSLSIKT
jgi:hypothetical protein